MPGKAKAQLISFYKDEKLTRVTLVMFGFTLKPGGFRTLTKADMQMISKKNMGMIQDFTTLFFGKSPNLNLNSICHASGDPMPKTSPRVKVEGRTFEFWCEGTSDGDGLQLGASVI